MKPVELYRALSPGKQEALWVILTAIAGLAACILLPSCASGAKTASDGITEGAAGAAGAALGGPLWAGVVAFFAHLWTASGGTAEAGLSLGFFAGLGNWIDQSIRWVLLGLLAAVVIFPRWRTQALAFVLGLPRLLLALFHSEPATAKNAVSDMLLAVPRGIGAVRESPRTRPTPIKRKTRP